MKKFIMQYMIALLFGMSFIMVFLNKLLLSAVLSIIGFLLLEEYVKYRKATDESDQSKNA